ncbi:50S ribosomal protein L4, partial [Candidatus Micrarchaeota archaeon]|nr:50S ribosomal protein L4 [Candidatus Micrarchaeota archaeon]
MSVKLPIQFNEEYRPDLIQRAFIAQRSLSLQPHGNYLLAGFQNTAKYYGRRAAFRQTINTGRSRLPREKIPKGRSGRVMRVPHAMGGHRAHPPKAIKRLLERINLKEKNKAIRSAIGATTNAELVKARNHAFSKAVPIIAPSSFEQIKRVK